jgi:hypothetical protein
LVLSKCGVEARCSGEQQSGKQKSAHG